VLMSHRLLQRLYAHAAIQVVRGVASVVFIQVAREDYDALYDASILSSRGTPPNQDVLKGPSRVKGNFHARFLA
jgi:hypothetical protein